jgi:hypothetical protein
MEPAKMPDPPIPAMALAIMSIVDDWDRPPRRAPRLKMAMNVRNVAFSGNSWKSLPVRGAITQLESASQQTYLMPGIILPTSI